MATLGPSERRTVAGAFITLLGIIAGHTLLETARDALFLSKVGAEKLPWVYIGIAFVSVIVASFNRRCLVCYTRHFVLSVTLLCSGGISVVLFFLVALDHAVVYYALYAWAGIAATILMVQFWLVIGDALSITQAKRYVGFIGSGGIFGGIIGSLMGRFLAASMPGAHLILAAAGCFIVTGIVPLYMLRVAQRFDNTARLIAETGETLSARAMLRDPYLRKLTWFVLIAVCVLTVADYLFKSVVVQYVAPNEMPGFFALIHLGLNIASLFIQTIVTTPLLKSLGVVGAATVIPAAMALGAGGVLLFGGIASVVALKATEGSLRYSLLRSVSELLYFPVPIGLRGVAKRMIDGAVHRSGQALASIGIVGMIAIGADPQHYAIILLVLIAIWLFVTMGMGSEYLAMFRKNLKTGSIEQRMTPMRLDVTSLEAIITSLGSADAREVITAMELLQHIDKGHLIPPLLLNHPDNTVVLHALSVFHQNKRSSASTFVRTAFDHKSATIRAAALRTYAVLAHDSEQLVRMIDDNDAGVRTSALVALALHPTTDIDAQAMIVAQVQHGSPSERELLALAMAAQPSPIFTEPLIELANASESSVLRAVAQAMGDIADPRFVPWLVRMVGTGGVRPMARRALLNIGSPALRYLARAIDDESLPRHIRLHLPRTVSQFPGVEAVHILQQRLLQEPDGSVRFKILRGMGRLLKNNPTLPIDVSIVRKARDLAIQEAMRLAKYHSTLNAMLTQTPDLVSPASQLLLRLIEGKVGEAQERIFRLVAIERPNDEMQRVYIALRSNDPRQGDVAREILDSIADTENLSGIIDLINTHDTFKQAKRSISNSNKGLAMTEALLRNLMKERSMTIRAFAAQWASDLGIACVVPQLRRMCHETLPAGLHEMVAGTLDSFADQQSVKEIRE